MQCLMLVGKCRLHAGAVLLAAGAWSAALLAAHASSCGVDWQVVPVLCCAALCWLHMGDAYAVDSEPKLSMPHALLKRALVGHVAR